MRRIAILVRPPLLVAAGLTIAARAAPAVSIGFPSSGPTTPTFDMPPMPPNPGMPSPNPLPVGSFAENLSSFHLALRG